MGYLAYKGSSGMQYFSGTKYVNPELGTHKFCIRTGTGNNDVIKYGLTTQSSASKYCGLKFRISNMDARIGKYGDQLSSASSSSWKRESKSSISKILTTTLAAYLTSLSRTSSYGSTYVDPFKRGWSKSVTTSNSYTTSSTSTDGKKSITVNWGNTSYHYSNSTFYQKQSYNKTTSLSISISTITCYATSVNQSFTSFFEGDYQDNFNL